MKRLSSVRPTPALIVAMIALVAAMSGAAVALPGKNSVKKNDIKNGAVTGKKIAEGVVKSKHIKGNRLKDGAVGSKQLKDDAVTSAKVEPESLDSSDISDYRVIGTDANSLVRLTATDGATAAEARTAAPETVLAELGQLTITAKCFRDTSTDETFAEMYVKTSADGAIFDGSTDELSGGPAATDFLNTDTPETDRVLDDTSVTAPGANLDEGEFSLVSADGHQYVGQSAVAAKAGDLAGGNGVYGAGNVCLFGGEIAG
jgi:predicted RecA/RadA family phage recombinase